MKLVTLGTSGAMPTGNRGLACAVLALDKEYIMVDCGEGTTKQYVQTNLKWDKPTTILITHMHLDHIGGILGFLQSMDLLKRKKPIKIYGIKGIAQYVNLLHRGQGVKFGYDFEIIEIKEGDVIKGDSFTVTVCNSVHSIKPSVAYRIELPEKEGGLDIDKCIKLGVPKNSPLLGRLKHGEDVVINSDVTDKGTFTVKSKDVVGEPRKGKVICFSGDTRPTDKLREFYHNADVVLHEATFLEDEKELALKVGHSTAYEAGLICNQAGAGKTILTHFSARHASLQPIHDEASKTNPNIICAKDFMEIELD